MYYYLRFISLKTLQEVLGRTSAFEILYLFSQVHSLNLVRLLLLVRSPNFTIAHHQIWWDWSKCHFGAALQFVIYNDNDTIPIQQAFYYSNNNLANSGQSQTISEIKFTSLNWNICDQHFRSIVEMLEKQTN